MWYYLPHNFTSQTVWFKFNSSCILHLTLTWTHMLPKKAWMHTSLMLVCMVYISDICIIYKNINQPFLVFISLWRMCFNGCTYCDFPPDHLRCWYSCHLPAPSGSTAAAFVRCSVAGRAAGARGSLWDAGGICHHGDRAGTRADVLQSEGSAHHGTQSQGLYY